jgi:acyl-lipid omega-6 desaturase (Delta-12 desaturase)
MANPFTDPLNLDSGLSQENVVRFQTPSASKAAWQVANSVVPYALLWVAMVFALSVSYWLMLPLAIVAAGFLARIFIIFHDCGHGSFFRSKRANQFTGTIAAFLNLTPYRHWRWQHALHHGTSGDLDRRGSGDIWTLTVQEYRQSTRWRRFSYRLARNPFVLFVIAPLYVFVVHHRFAVSSAPARERQSVRRTNWALLAVTALMSALIGLKALLLIQLTVTAFAGALGLWLFYVSINLRERTGLAVRSGITRPPRFMAARSINCPESCSGSPAISDFITSTT